MKKLPTMLVSLAVIAVAAAAIIIALNGKNMFGSEISSADKQVVLAVETKQEIVLVGLSIQGITQKSADGNFFGLKIPGTERDIAIQYSFEGKLGFDGAQVKIEQRGDHAYTVVLPMFKFIAYGDPEFHTIAEQHGVISLFTPQIDKVAMINEVFGPELREEYLRKNDGLLREQAQAFYNGIISAIDPDADVKFRFYADATR